MIVDLFAGPGGWSTGLNMIGRSETIGIEWDKAACDTARAAGHERLQADIAQLDPFAIGGSSVEGLIASPPCQGFSLAGKGKGREDSTLIIAATGDMASGLDPRATLASKVKDDRSILALEPLRWALDLEPVWTAWEQVPAVLPLWEACAEVLRADGYSVWTGLVQAEEYGVPQTRKRAILTATRSGQAARPIPTHSKYYRSGRMDEGVQKWVSMAEGLGWGLTNRPSYTVCAGGSGHAIGDTEWGGESVRKVLRDARDSGDPARWMPPIWAYHRPSYTVTGGGTGSGGAEPFGNGARQQMSKGGGNVRITFQEAGLLQSFPADYPWQGGKTAAFRQAGDAVPPLMAAHVLASIGVGALRKEKAA